MNACERECMDMFAVSTLPRIWPTCPPKPLGRNRRDGTVLCRNNKRKGRYGKGNDSCKDHPRVLIPASRALADRGRQGSQRSVKEREEKDLHRNKAYPSRRTAV